MGDAGVDAGVVLRVGMLRDVAGCCGWGAYELEASTNLLGELVGAAEYVRVVLW